MNPEHNTCYIAYGGEEIAKEEYDVSDLYTVHFTLYTEQVTQYTVHCAQYTVQCTVYSAHCTVHNTPQILVAPRNCDLRWVDANGGYIPTGAIQVWD